MANGLEQGETTPSLAGGHSKDTKSGLEIPVPPGSPVPPDSPEDVVRKLMDAEAGNLSPPAPAFHQAAEPSKATNNSSDATRYIGRLARRLTAAPKRVISNTCSKARTAILSYRPMPRHMAILLVVIIAFTLPWLIPILFLLGLILAVVSYLSLGHDRAAELAAGWYRRLTHRNPKGAEQLRARAERISARLTTWAGYLPQSWTVGLYLPEFSLPDEGPEKLADDPYERLAGDPYNR